MYIINLIYRYKKLEHDKLMIIKHDILAKCHGGIDVMRSVTDVTNVFHDLLVHVCHVTIFEAVTPATCHGE